MARPREFDETTVLDAAMACFWDRGYEATSVRDLAERTGLTHASLYNAFGDKRALYARALDRYLDLSVRDRIVRLESTLGPRDALVAYFDEVISRSLNDRRRRGCLLVNSALEVAPHDAAIRRVVDAELVAIEAFFLRCLRAFAEDGGDLDGKTPDDMARLLLGVLLGIRVLARTRPQRVLLEGIVRPVLAMLTPRKRRRTAPSPSPSRARQRGNVDVPIRN